MKITTNLDELRTTLAPVFRRYPQQSQPQPAHIELDLFNVEVSVGYSGEIGNAVPARVYYGLTRRLTISSYAKGEALAEYITGPVFTTLFYSVSAGFSTLYDDQGNLAGVLSEDAAKAMELLEEVTRNHFAHEFNQSQVWTPGEYLQSIEERIGPTEPVTIAYPDFGTITADSTDEHLQAMADAITTDAEQVQGITFDGTVLAYLEEGREECRRNTVD